MNYTGLGDIDRDTALQTADTPVAAGTVVVDQQAFEAYVAEVVCNHQFVVAVEGGRNSFAS